MYAIVFRPLLLIKASFKLPALSVGHNIYKKLVIVLPFMILYHQNFSFIFHLEGLHNQNYHIQLWNNYWCSKQCSIYAPQ